MHNAFNILQHKGFLHDEGINTLEAIQTFYDLIKEKPRKSGYVEKKLIDFCPPGHNPNREYQPVVLLVKQNQGHAVALKKYSNDRKTLTLTVIDSAAPNGETIVKERLYNFFMPL